MQGVRKRVITATIFVAIMLVGIIAGAYTFLILFGTINFLCLWEFFGLVLGKDRSASMLRNILGISFGLLPFLFSGSIQMAWIPYSSSFLMFYFIIFILCFYLIFVVELFRTSDHALQFLSYLILGIIYIGSSFAVLNSIAFVNGVYQFQIVLGIVLLVWTNDTAAYFVGSKLGKTLLFPRISPKKTWEGSIGAAIITLIIAFPVSLVLPYFQFGIWVCIAIIIFTAGGIGDLVESMFKRSINTKDSGSLLPGHGGFLDRFDAFIFSVPFIAAFLIFTGQI